MKPASIALRRLSTALKVASVVARMDLDGIGDDRVDRFCSERGVPVHLRIPFDRRIAEAYSRGVSMVRELPETRGSFRLLYREIASAGLRS